MRLTFLLVISIAAIPAVCQADSDADARTFVQSLYDRYSHDGSDYLGRDAPTTFASNLLQLIRRVQAATPKGYAGTPDWDPICGCQDPDGLKVLDLSIEPTSGASASADVRLGFPDGTHVSLKLKLARQGKAWRVSDVEEAGASLRAVLGQALRYSAH